MKKINNMKNVVNIKMDLSQTGKQTNKPEELGNIMKELLQVDKSPVYGKLPGTYSWFARYVMAAMLVPDNKAFLISFSCSFQQHGRCAFVFQISRDSLQTINRPTISY